MLAARRWHKFIQKAKYTLRLTQWEAASLYAIKPHDAAMRRQRYVVHNSLEADLVQRATPYKTLSDAVTAEGHDKDNIVICNHKGNCHAA